MVRKEDIYKKTQVNTSSPISILVMLYERAIQDIEHAKELYKKNSYDDQLKGNEKIEHANEIITELMATLNFEKGGNVANELFSIYSFLSKELNEIIITKDVNKINNVLKQLKSLHNAWKELLKSNNHSKTNSTTGLNIVG